MWWTPRLSRLIERLEDWLEPKLGPWYERHKKKLPLYAAPGSGKSRGFIIPFLMGCAQRKESVFITDPKGELFEKLSPYFKQHGHYVKAVNFLDMAHSDGWNCLYGLDTETQLVQTVANTIIQNTSGAREADDFWSRAELNLLMALIHYVVNLKDANGDLLPIEKRGLGDVYQMLAHQSIQEIKITISTTSSQRPQTPLFASVYSGARYSQTRSNTQRELMQPDEILRLDRRQCIALFQGRKPALLYKLSPEELPGYDKLESCRVADYTPEWRLKEGQGPEKQPPAPPKPEAGPKVGPDPPRPDPLDEPNPAKDTDYQINDLGNLGMVELGPGGVVGGDDEEDVDSPPGR